MNEIIEIFKKELYNSFGSLAGIKLSYEYNVNINTHIIEVLPTKAYNSKEYIDLEIAFEEKMIDLFPEQELIFISEDSLTEMISPSLLVDTTLVDFAKIPYKIKEKFNFGFSDLEKLGFGGINEMSSTNYLAA